MNERIRRVLAEVLAVPEAAVGEDASPKTIATWDSLRQMSLIVALEAEFSVLFDDTLVNQLQSFSAIRSAIAAAS